jgi:hypothetical protein
MKTTITRYPLIRSASIGVAALAIFLCCETSAFALGNRTAQEYGDAVYRKLTSTSWFGYNYNHAGLFAGQSGGVKRCIEADTLLGDTTHDNTFSGSFSGYGSDYYGAFTLNYGTPTFSQRKAVMATAKQVADAYIYYTYFSALDPLTSTRPVTIANIDNFRCDGVVEYCYEVNNLQSWWHTSYPSRWQISMYPEEHNDAPDLTVNPDTEESPWSQRGAPASSSEGPGYSGANPNNARLTTSAVITLPTTTASYTRINATTIDVTISAKDESGIARVGYILPGSSTWSYTAWQAQYPTSDTYAPVIRITSAGTLYYFAEDNGGNYPASAPGVSFYTVSSSAGTGGTISPSGSVLVPYGQGYPFTASPNANYTVDKWYLDGVAIQTGGTSYTLSNVQANRSLQVTFKLSAISVTVQTSPAGRSFSVDGTTYSSAQIFNWTPSSSHTIATTSPQSGGTGIQYVWGSWSDAGVMSHTVAPSSGTTYTANFTTQYYLTEGYGTGGNTVSPGGGWYNSGASIGISATPASGYSFSSWSGSGSGSYSGSSLSPTITMNGPITELANFTANPVSISVTVQPNPSGRSFTVDGTPYTTAQIFSWVSGSSHTIATSSPQSGGSGIQYVWSNWSDGGAISHSIAPTVNGSTYTANFTTQYYLTMGYGTGGSSVSPGSGWYNSGANFGISATAASGYSFSSWTGSGSGSYSGSSSSSSVTMNGPISETASFIQNPPPAPTAYAASNRATNAFTANWSAASGATGYRLDVSTNNAFSNFVTGYQDLDVGNVLSRNVTGLTIATTYYYRVRAYNGNGTSSSSATITTGTTGPAISFTKQGNNFILSWPTNDPAFKLFYATNPATLAWISNTVSPSIVGGRYTITNSMTNRVKLYHLRK